MTMDYESVEMTHDHEDVRKMDASSEAVKSEMILLNEKPQDPPKEVKQANKVHTTESEDVTMRVASADMEVCGEVNMEASISTDDVMRAGGFGARDDISCFLPVASDSTDFEASLRDARDYEEPQDEICRPGLGWKDIRE